MSEVSFDDLVATATVGVARKGRPAGELAGPAGRPDVTAEAGAALGADEPAAALLDAAALLTAARRGGVQPARDVAVPDVTVPDVAGPDVAGPDAAGPERELSARAARLLRQIGPADGSILSSLLTAARDAGYVLPAPLLPVLLEAAVRDTGLRPAVAGVLGTRGRWLAGHRKDWRRVVGQGQAAGTQDTGTPGAEIQTWQAGTNDERRGVLAAMRRRDPAVARELLASGWKKETAADRAALLDMLRHGLSGADEEFLESALDDRSSGVRETAQELLARLPGSAFSRRAAERAAPLLRVERHGLRRRLAVTLPPEPDVAGTRDGMPSSSPVRGLGDGAWRLIHLLGAAPLSDWTQRFRLSPADLAGLAVADDLSVHVHAGWRRAVTSQHGTGLLTDEELTAWAVALLSVDTGAEVNRDARTWPGDTALAAVLPPAMRVERLARLLKQAGTRAGRPTDWGLASEVDACPVPWPPALADAVLDVIARTSAQPDPPSLSRRLLNLASGGMPVTGPRDYAAELARIPVAQLPGWAALFDNATQMIARRRAFLAELRLPDLFTR